MEVVSGTFSSDPFPTADFSLRFRYDPVDEPCKLVCRGIKNGGENCFSGFNSLICNVLTFLHSDSMKIRSLLFLCGMLCSVVLHASAQTYEQLWDSAKAYEKQDLPRSVLQIAARIGEKARREGNKPQRILAFLAEHNCHRRLTPDSLETDMQRLAEWFHDSVDSVEQAVLASLLGEMLMPQDPDSAVICYLRSLRDRELLGRTSANTYRPLVVNGRTSVRYFRNNLYDLLAQRAAEAFRENRWRKDDDMPRQAVYDSLTAYYASRGEREALLLTRLKRIRNWWWEPESQRRSQSEVENLIREFSDLDVCAEAYLVKTELAESPLERLKCAREAIARYPSYSRIGALKKIEQNLLRPALSVGIEDDYPGGEMKVKVSHNNLDGFTLCFYRLNVSATSRLLSKSPNDACISQYGRLVVREHFALTRPADYAACDTLLTVQAPEAGIYVVKAIPDGKLGRANFSWLHLSPLYLAYRRLGNSRFEFTVLDKRSGHPVKDAEVVCYDDEPSASRDAVVNRVWPVDERGAAVVETPKSKSSRLYFNARTQQGNFQSVRSVWSWSPDPSRKGMGWERKSVVLTDRAVYRPGQTVRWTGFIYEQKGDSTRVAAGCVSEVALYGPDRKQIANRKVQTNDFGSYSGEFTLPASGLAGQFLISVAGSSVAIHVEEYKRPTFEVTLGKVAEAYKVGDTVLVKGRAQTFAGVPVQQGRVHYSVRYAVRIWDDATEAASGETLTDDEGRFEIPAYLDGPDAVYFGRFEVHAEVTDLAGETQVGMVALPIEDKSLNVYIEGFVDMWPRGWKGALCFKVVNPAEVPMQTDVIYRVFRLPQEELANPAAGECVLERSRRSNQSFKPEDIDSLTPGRYRLQAEVRDANGVASSVSRDFILFSPDAVRPPVERLDWFYQRSGEFGTKEPVLWFGTSARDVYVLYDVFSDGRRVESRRMMLSDTIVPLSFPDRAEYGKALSVNIAFVRGGRLYGHDVDLKRPAPDKRLLLKWETFRDRMQPGQRQEWRLRVTHPDGTPADAELMAAMYDASLDEFVEHEWPFDLDFDREYGSYRTSWSKVWSSPARINCDFRMPGIRYPALSYSRFVSGTTGGYDRLVVVLNDSGVTTEVDFAEFDEDTEVLVLNAVAVDTKQADGSQPFLVAEQMPSFPGAADVLAMRRDFSETAFFYPHLHTDADGGVSFSFTMPESLTEWMLLGLAHTREVDYGSIAASAYTVKDFMLTPNMPRFVRVGDKAQIAASLMNRSEEPVAGEVRFELFDPSTDKVFHRVKAPFAVAAGKTQRVAFDFSVSESHPLVACRMVADGGTFSDGEQCYLPVLTDKEWVTESLSLDTDAAGEQAFPIGELFNNQSRTATQRRLTVEFTSNPAWYAVQALPGMTAPRSDDALSWVSVYYAATLGRHIALRNPRIKAFCDQYKAGGKATESALQRDGELKILMLEETPWLAEAESETERMAALSLLFDENAAWAKIRTAIERLKGLQDSEGAFGWYKGMPGNRYITMQVAEMLIRLQSLTGEAPEPEIAAMTDRACDYLAQGVREEYDAARATEAKYGKKQEPSELTLHYLYICAVGDLPLTPAQRKVNGFFIARLAGMTRQLTLYGKGAAAITLQKAGYAEAATLFVQSLKEYSVSTPAMGRWFDAPSAYASWRNYRIPTEVMAIEALGRVARDTTAVGEMKRWLLQQKRTQSWETSVATADAVYALLADGKALAVPAPGAAVSVARAVVGMEPGNPAGYLKETFTAPAQTRASEVVVRKDAPGMAWGAVYAQYLEQADKLGARGEDLSVERAFFRNGERLKKGAKLRVGERITVRLTVKSARNLDFVQLKDMRPACMDPVDVLSGYARCGNVWCYRVTRDAATEFFADQLKRGTHVFEYDVRVARSGEYQTGLASVQSAYSPEFSGRSGSSRIVVE